MSLASYVGNNGNLLLESPQHCHAVALKQPILTSTELEKLRSIDAMGLWQTYLSRLLMRRVCHTTIRHQIMKTRKAIMSTQSATTITHHQIMIIQKVITLIVGQTMKTELMVQSD